MSLNIFLNILTNYLVALLAIAFYTLLERKILGYAQERKGPNKVGVIGLPQPLADALKLFIKEQATPSQSNPFPYILAPIIRLILALILWSLYPTTTPSLFITLGIILFICISSLNVYTTLGAGWSSNSKYALLGALRRVAQTISYEIRIALILIAILCIYISFNFFKILNYTNLWIFFLTAPLIYIWFITCLAETNRTPFDFAEGESELVSGFNVEYSRGRFALIFIAEYINILFIRILSAILFLSSERIFLLSNLSLVIKTTILAFLFIWIRGRFPRIRYDRLINLTWKTFLPSSIIFLFINLIYILFIL